jgi:hypothetical protein
MAWCLWWWRTFSVAAKKPLAGFCVLFKCRIHFVYNSYVKNLPNRVHNLRQLYLSCRVATKKIGTCEAKIFIICAVI